MNNFTHLGLSRGTPLPPSALDWRVRLYSTRCHLSRNGYDLGSLLSSPEARPARRHDLAASLSIQIGSSTTLGRCGVPELEPCARPRFDEGSYYFDITCSTNCAGVSLNLGSSAKSMLRVQYSATANIKIPLMRPIQMVQLISSGARLRTDLRRTDQGPICSLPMRKAARSRLPVTPV
jgi:hypothetical protein